MNRAPAFSARLTWSTVSTVPRTHEDITALCQRAHGILSGGGPGGYFHTGKVAVNESLRQAPGIPGILHGDNRYNPYVLYRFQDPVHIDFPS